MKPTRLPPLSCMAHLHGRIKSTINQTNTMPNISVLKSSRFLKKEDVGTGVLVTVESCVEINVAKEGAPEEFKWCLNFKETDKPLVLNSTKGQIIAGFLGSDNTDNWAGHKIVLYHDPNISFAGKLIGGIGVRAPKTPQARPVPAPVRPQEPPPVPGLPPEGEGEDNVPF